MKKIHIVSPYKIDLIQKYIRKHIRECDNNIEIFHIEITPENKSKLCVSFENGEFYWVDGGEKYMFCYSKEGDPSSTQNAYYNSFTIGHENIDVLQEFVTKILTMEHNLTVNTSNSHGYWNTYEVTNMNAIKIDNLFLPTDTFQKVFSLIDNFTKEDTRKEYVERGDTYKMSFLLTGIPGSGKSSLIKAIGAKYRRNIYYLNFSKTLQDDILLDLMAKIPVNSILAIEDADSYFTDDKTSDINVSQSIILNILDGGNDSFFDNVLIFITANDINKLSPAMKRPGRINHIVKFDYPCKAEIEKAFLKYVTPHPDNAERFREFYKQIKGKKLCMAAIKEYVLSHKDDYMDHIEELIGDINERTQTEHTEKMFL